MSHFARIDEDNIVIGVIVAEQDEINTGVFGDSFLFVQTSYNGNFRGHFATFGDTWNPVLNKFISPKPYDSWISDDAGGWEAPVSEPSDMRREDGLIVKPYIWNEGSGQWVVMEETEQAVLDRQEMLSQ